MTVRIEGNQRLVWTMTKEMAQALEPFLTTQALACSPSVLSRDMEQVISFALKEDE